MVTVYAKLVSPVVDSKRPQIHFDLRPSRSAARLEHSTTNSTEVLACW